MKLKYMISALVLGVAIAVPVADAAQDWRNTVSTAKKVDKLVAVMPATGNIMIEMGERYKNLYWAAKLGQWDFADYQAEEMEELIDKLKITRPELTKTANEFLKNSYPHVSQVVRSRDWDKFSVMFENLRSECMACHSKNEHGFIALPLPKRASSPVLNME
jgi:hypothetical protein